ncbi:sensor histidine kinase [Thermodesulfobacteriota bacterium]
MHDENKTKKQLIDELNQLRRKIVQQEASYGRHNTNHQQNLSTMRTELETERAERLIEKQETQIVLDKMQQENYERNRFFSIISHDLRSPVIAIAGLSQLIIKRFDEENHSTLKDWLVRLNKSANALSHLADSLLAWAKTQIGRFQCEWENIEINTIVDENLSLFCEGSRRKGIRLYAETEDEMIAYADYDMINAVVRNLVSNAIKFTDKNGEVKITAKKTKGGIEVSVSDTGMGFDADTLRSIFEDSPKNSLNGTEGEKGAGLGLLLCKELIKKNKSEMMIESNQGCGTTVYFMLLENYYKKIKKIRNKKPMILKGLPVHPSDSDRMLALKVEV